MIRVLHVINWFRYGGSETQLLRLLRGYDRALLHMDVCCVGDGLGYLAHEARAAGATLHLCRKSADMRGFSARMERLLRVHRYEVVHSHFDLWSGPVLRGAARAGVPHRLAHVRGPEAGRTRHDPLPARAGRALLRAWGRRWVRRHATRVLGVSASVLDDSYPEWRDAPGRFEVLTGGVDTEALRPGDVAAAPPRLLSIGTFSRTKRQDLALEVFAGVARARPDARLAFVGYGPEEAACRARAEALGLAARVDFLGRLERPAVAAALGESAALLTCSELEGLPNAVLEALACGLPVVASDIPAHRELLGPVSPETLFPLRDPAAGGRAAAELLADPARRAALGARGRAHVVASYDAKDCLARLEGLYLDLALGGRG